MCKTSGNETTRVEKWEDEKDDDDDSFASHSRRTVGDEENDNDDLIYSASHSRSIYFSAQSIHVEDDLSERSSRSEELEDNGLMARGSPTLARSFLKPPEEEPYRDSLSTRSQSQRKRTFDIIQFDEDSDDEKKSVEKDGLLVEEIEPFEKRKRYLSLCFRVTLIFAISGVIGLATMFGAIELQRRNSLRGNGTKAIDSPPADALFGTHSSMTNTHGLDVNAGEPGLTNPHGVEINPCQDNMAFRHENHAGQNCQWVAKFNRAQRCANERILTNCRATCDPSCGASDWAEEHEKDDNEVTEFPTEGPTSYPTLFPTAVVSSWSTEDLTEADTAWETEPLSDFASENVGNDSTRD